MLVLGYGINLDVEDLTFAVLDRDQTPLSRDYVLSLSGSRYFIERPPIRDHDEMDQRIARRTKSTWRSRSRRTSVATSKRGDPVAIGAGSTAPCRARRDVRRLCYRACTTYWLSHQDARDPTARAASMPRSRPAFATTRDVESLLAMGPTMIPLLLLLIPAILMRAVAWCGKRSWVPSSISTSRRSLAWSFCSASSFPTSRWRCVNFLMLTGLAVFCSACHSRAAFPRWPSPPCSMLCATTAFGLLVSTFVSSQIAARFRHRRMSILPTVQFSGMIEPVSSLVGGGASSAALPGHPFPDHDPRHVLERALASRISKLLGAPAITVPVLIGLGAFLLKKQER